MPILLFNTGFSGSRSEKSYWEAEVIAMSSVCEKSQIILREDRFEGYKIVKTIVCGPVGALVALEATKIDGDNEEHRCRILKLGSDLPISDHPPISKGHQCWCSIPTAKLQRWLDDNTVKEDGNDKG